MGYRVRGHSRRGVTVVRVLKDTTLRRGALGLFVTSISLNVASLALAPGISGHPGLAHDEFRLDTGFLLTSSVLMLTGLLLTWARPRNAVGWLLATSGLLGALSNVGQ